MSQFQILLTLVGGHKVLETLAIMCHDTQLQELKWVVAPIPYHDDYNFCIQSFAHKHSQRHATSTYPNISEMYRSFFKRGGAV